MIAPVVTVRLFRIGHGAIFCGESHGGGQSRDCYWGACPQKLWLGNRGTTEAPSPYFLTFSYASKMEEERKPK